MSLEGKRTLIFAILKFLREESKQENIAPDLKESLEGMVDIYRPKILSSIHRDILIIQNHKSIKKIISI